MRIFYGFIRAYCGGQKIISGLLHVIFQTEVLNMNLSFDKGRDGDNVEQIQPKKQKTGTEE